ncbi:unnamed protein product [marine sediment metagenome]|uniref:Uncharacterized protein n=1 Tax=marine sediment metagenome TaxID=412755 RepID=X1KV72_9ZZZZ
MKLIIVLVVVIGALIVLKSMAESKSLTISELIRSWFPTAPTDLGEGEEPFTWKVSLNPTTTEALTAQIQWQ